jgi:voltage-gated sodium channel
MNKSFAKAITSNKLFEIVITLIIIINSILIGVETSYSAFWIWLTQKIILGIFTIEIVLRFIAADNVKSFFKDGWNVFDLTLVIIGYIPSSISINTSAMMALRVLRVFRVLRLLRVSKEIKLIISVLLKSMRSMFYNVILFLIFIYLFAIVGVGLFKMPTPDNLDATQVEKYELYKENALNLSYSSPDPFASVGEAMFTLFRELTGDDWATLRYNHTLASDYGLISCSSTVINLFHIIWVVISAFLLLNIVTGAIINNYEEVLREQQEKQKE